MGPERQYTLPSPTEKGLWGGEGTASTKSKQERRGLVPVPLSPGSSAKAGAGVAGVRALPVLAEPKRAAQAAASPKHVVRGLAGLPPPHACSLGETAGGGGGRF